MNSDITHTHRFESDLGSNLGRKQHYPYPIHTHATVFEFYPNPIKPYFLDLIGFGYDVYPSDQINLAISKHD